MELRIDELNMTRLEWDLREPGKQADSLDDLINLIIRRHYINRDMSTLGILTAYRKMLVNQELSGLADDAKECKKV